MLCWGLWLSLRQSETLTANSQKHSALGCRPAWCSLPYSPRNDADAVCLAGKASPFSKPLAPCALLSGIAPMCLAGFADSLGAQDTVVIAMCIVQVDLVLFYTTHKIGESWNNWSYLQAAG